MSLANLLRKEESPEIKKHGIELGQIAQFFKQNRDYARHNSEHKRAYFLIEDDSHLDYIEKMLGQTLGGKQYKASLYKGDLGKGVPRILEIEDISDEHFRKLFDLYKKRPIATILADTPDQTRNLYLKIEDPKYKGTIIEKILKSYSLLEGEALAGEKFIGTALHGKSLSGRTLHSEPLSGRTLSGKPLGEDYKK